MKITAVRTSTLMVPNSPPASTFYSHTSYVVARVQTDEGVEGLGYTMLMGGNGAAAVRSYLEERLAPQLVGENPFHTSRLWKKMYDADLGIRIKGIAAYALSALDIALWDIVGKAAGKPLYQLLGVHTERVPVYGSGGFLSYSVDEIVREAQGFIEQGCRHYKMKIGRPDMALDVERVRAVRKALGDGIALMVDVNQRWSVAQNLRAARKLEDLDLFWYEEPVIADSVAHCAEVARGTSIPIATGENEATRFGFRDLLEQRAASFLQPDVHRCGGIGEIMRIAHLAAAYDIPIAPHLAPELSVSIVASIPNGSLVEWIAGWPPELWRDPPRIVDGHMIPPDRPGHGMEFGADAIKRFTA